MYWPDNGNEGHLTCPQVLSVDNKVCWHLVSVALTQPETALYHPAILPYTAEETYTLPHILGRKSSKQVTV